jgi:ribosome maturation factor RimP
VLLCDGLRKPPRGKGLAYFFQGIVIVTVVSHLEPIITPAVEAAGYRLVRLRLMGNKQKTLQVMAERPDGSMNVEDCTNLSRALSDFLAADDPLEGDYLLEVSSPGIDRPLTRLADFSRWAGHAAKIELSAPLDGKKRFKCVLAGIEGNLVAIEADGRRLALPFAAIYDAKLVLTDKLIEEDLRSRKG